MRTVSSGFTLIELVVTMSIMTIAIMLVIPTFKHIFLGMEIKSAIRNIYADIYFAKINSKINHKTFCTIINKEDGNDDWIWQVVEDTDNDGDCDSSDTIVKSQSFLESYPSITKINNNTVKTTDEYNFTIRFDSSGLAKTDNGTIDLTIEKEGYSKTLSVSVSPLGFIRIE